MKKNIDGSFGFQTRAVHGGNEIDAETGAIRRPITMANSYELPYDPSDMNWSSADGQIYTRNGGANQKYLQEKLALLHNAPDCVVLASGVAALSGVFFTFLKSGDRVLMSDSTYIAAYRLINELFPDKFGVEKTLVDTSDLAAVEAAITPNTKLIHIETPSNPTLKVSDIRAIAKIAHERGALLSVDNTFASPYNQRPYELGADLTVESLTKYINGHGDAMGGAVLGEKPLIDKIRSQAMVNLGGAISPFNAWLIMRGAATLPLRMKQHNSSAQKIAEFLQTLPEVRFVAYPGLAEHKNHAVAAAQMCNNFTAYPALSAQTRNDFSPYPAENPTAQTRNFIEYPAISDKQANDFSSYPTKNSTAQTRNFVGYPNFSAQKRDDFISYPNLSKDKCLSEKRMRSGFGGVLAFGLKTDHDGHNRFVSKLRVITNAVSLGHDESLIVFLGENDERQYLYGEEFHGGFFRLSVGLEDAEDLIEDIKQALKNAEI